MAELNENVKKEKRAKIVTIIGISVASAAPMRPNIEHVLITLWRILVGHISPV